jgi:transposase
MKYIGMDVHKSYSQVAVLDGKTGVLDEFRVDSDPFSVRKALSGYAHDSKIALEASSHWAWIVDELQDMNMDVVLSHPTKTKAIGSAKIKTDKIDAKMLSKLLAADMLPEAHISSPSVREMRSYLRYRCTLVTMRTQAKNRVHAIIAGYGLKPPCKDLFCKKGRTWLKDQTLRPLHREEADAYLDLIDSFSAHIAAVNKRIVPLCEEREDAMLLTSIPGIGYYSALLVVAEIDGIERFSTAKQLVSYGGLCPSTRSSGGTERHGHITRTGSRYLRWILVEAAQKARYSGSPYNRFYQSIANRKGAGTATVAVARKGIFQMLKKRQAFDAAAWNRRAG